MSALEWFGSAGHLCVSNMCRFHLTTKVGDVLVSTVGEYFPDPEAETPTKIGSGRTYETMVFQISGTCSCGCGLPTHSGDCLDSAGYNSPRDARDGHMAMIAKLLA